MNRKSTMRFTGLLLLIMAPWLVYANTTPEWSMATRLYNDLKARQVGDLVTVVIDESSSVSRSANQSAGKNTSMGGSASVSHPTLVVNGEARPTAWDTARLPDFNFQFQNSSSGGGQMDSKEDFTSTMSATVLDVLPNGNLLLEGKRTVQLQHERVQVILTGMVRPRDIASDNTVQSSRLADASIRYETEGPISRDQQRGLLTRMFNWLNLF